jgi:prepilin-type N-terminal cleavage/methylation domain-containing protein
VLYRRQKEAGFTILEVAVVMMVIGILFGGILLAMNMYRNMQIIASYTRVEAIKRATDEFIEQYEFLPGDMPNAIARFPLCDAPCQNGDGTGPGEEIFDAPAAPPDETALFWYHLAASGLFEGMDPDSPFVAGTGWGRIYPAAPAGGGYQVHTMGGFTQGLNNVRIKGLFIRWQANPEVDANDNDVFIVSPRDALRIDTKFDDAAPLTGKIRARGSDTALTANDGCREDETTYIAIETEPACYMYFRIREETGL